ncbi:MAG: PAS domain S-box protein [Bryobacteraceae bacterium]
MNTSEHPPNYDCLPDILLEELKNVGAFLMDMERRITSWSPGVERILGYTEKDFVGLDGSELFTPEDRERKADDRHGHWAIVMQENCRTPRRPNVANLGSRKRLDFFTSLFPQHRFSQGKARNDQFDGLSPAGAQP